MVEKRKKAMKVTMVMVMTIDGRVTRGNSPNIYSWTSKDDQNYFFSLIKKHNLIVMGRGTYESAREYIRLTPGKLRVVLTKDPWKYQSLSVKRQLEFSKENPRKLVSRLETEGYKDMLLVGGTTINTLFLKANLVNEAYVTIEPKIFGVGLHIVDGTFLNMNLNLMSIRKLNKKGTVLLKYAIKRKN